MKTDDLYIVNYCHPCCTPLLNIMRLPKDEAFALAYKMAEQNRDTTAFYRFADFENYYPRRLQTDKLLRARFIELGGKPSQEHPLSFVLQGSAYLNDWFGNGIVTRIPLSRISSDHISFTYGDSMASLEKHNGFTMLTKDMLLKVMSDYDGTTEEFMADVEKQCHYIEAQVWDDKCVNELILVTPTKEHELQVMEFREEMLKNGEGFYGCSGLNRVSGYDEWLDFEGRFERLGWAPSAAYLGIRVSDGRLIGMIDLRHELSGFLLKYNGQIGYSVRPSERKKGYAAQMLLLVLKEAENFGYKKVLVCCNKANARSARVIQKCGGVLENEVVHEFSPPDRPDIIQRYWLETCNNRKFDTIANSG